MAQSESYDLQTQRMTASQPNNGKIFGRFDPIHIGLAVVSIIFLILSIVFIILFATKHDTSTGFLSTGFSTSKHDDVANELRGLLSNKYTVNSFALDTQNNVVSAVFSLRGSISTDDVQKVLSGSKLVTQVETTYGDKATAVCRQQEVFLSTVPATQAPSTATTTTKSAPTTTQAAPVTAKYCKNNAVNRDIVIIVDLNDLKKNNHTEKIASLQAIRGKLLAGLTLPQVSVFLKAVVADKIQDVSTTWSSTTEQINADFDNLFKITTYTETTSLDFVAVLQSGLGAFNSGRPYVPGAIFLLTDKGNSQDPNAVFTSPKELGIFVGVSGVRESYISQYKASSDMLLPYDSWTSLATADPFQTLVCSFYSLPSAQLTSRFSYPWEQLDDQTNVPTCQVLDMIIAFDTSESLSRLILPKYVDFAKKIVAQYKYKDDDFTRVGIITFNSLVTEKITLTAGTTLAAVDAAIDSVQYTAGLTDVTAALNQANTLFTQESSGSRSKVLIVLSDAVPTVDTYQDEINAGQNLAKNGVAVFFVGYSSYSDDVKKELGQVTNPDYVFGDMSDASLKGLTDELLVVYPCPQPKCVTAYYAIEISEATDDYVVQNLKDIITIATKAATLQTGTESYQLISYNEGPIHVNPQGDSSINAFIKYVQGLIDDPTKIAILRGGNTRLDTAITSISAELSAQIAKNSRFSGNIIFFGQANDAVLDPDETTDQKRAQLSAAATALSVQTAGLIFVVDDSRREDLFGADLWNSVTSQNRIIANSVQTEASLENTDYFTTWSMLSCSLPARATCYDTQVDVAVILDMQNKDYVFLNYITSLLSQFSSQDDAHFSMLAYGSRPTTVLSNLASHSTQDIQNLAVVYEDWRNGSYFTTTVAPTSTTPLPTTSTVQTTSTKKAQDFLTNNLYQVDKDTISGVFDAASTQFGCGHYSENGDRLFAPNLFIFASDNFGTYTQAVWEDFQTEIHKRYGCWDCAATPSFLFLSRTKDVAGFGTTINLSDADLDIDATDDTSTQSSINKFNTIVGNVCGTKFPQCSSYTCVAA